MNVGQPAGHAALGALVGVHSTARGSHQQLARVLDADAFERGENRTKFGHQRLDQPVEIGVSSLG